MIGRMRGALRRRGRQDSAPLRPNQLRLEDVRATRLRREASRAAVPTEEAPRPRPRRAEVVSPGRPGPPRIGALLSSRSGLRRAMLLREILGPPLALRDRHPGPPDA